MDHADWSQAPPRPLAVFLNGDGITESGLRGEDITDDSFLLLLNPGHEDVLDDASRRPLRDATGSRIVDTADPTVSDDRSKPLQAGQEVTVVARSVIVLRHA